MNDKFVDTELSDVCKELDLVNKILFLLIFWLSAEFDGCIKLINKKVVNITFFKVLTINVDKNS